MKPKTLNIAIAVLALVSGAFGLAHWRRSHGQRHAQAGARCDSISGLAGRREEVMRRTAEIADVPRQAPRETRIPAPLASGIALADRDPEKGPVPVEYFANAGQATPSAAFQTALWAAMNGKEDVLRETLTLDSAGRQKAEELLARLPSDGRAKYPTSESLAALAWMWIGENTHGLAVQVMGTTLVDAHHAIVRTRSAATGRESLVSLQLFPAGWRLVVSEGAIDSFERRISAVP